jgi:hypothetical protein
MSVASAWRMPPPQGRATDRRDDAIRAIERKRRRGVGEGKGKKVDWSLPDYPVYPFHLPLSRRSAPARAGGRR